MMVRSLDPVTVALQGVNLVEAAAGTGKTWTITALYLRLLLEGEMQVGQILVVTYTRAATGELRQRLRGALTKALNAFAGKDDGDDPLVGPLLLRYPDHHACALKLRRAIADFDQAGVFTIHGFCERVLGDSAFQSAIAFETEVLADERALLGEVVDDLWRREIYPASHTWVGWLASNKQLRSGDDLLALLAPLIGKPYLAVAGPVSAPPPAQLEGPLADAYHSIAQSWREQGEVVSQLLLDPDTGLNRQRYPVKSLPKWLAQLNALLSGPTLDFAQLKAFKPLEKLGSSFLLSPAATRKNADPPVHPFFDEVDSLLSCFAAYQDAASAHYVTWLNQMLSRADAAQRELKTERGVQAYDDLLLNLDAAVQPGIGDVLLQQLRGDYQAALLDEFQDTDPVQYQIFNTIYGAGAQPVFLVGDPKQAIYSFRGADLFAYLKARAGTAHHYTLDTNHRATPELVKAVNTVFSHRAPTGSFVFDEIPFNKAVSAATAPHLIDDDMAAPLVFWPIDRQEPGKLVTKTDARALASISMATEIRRLLSNATALGDRLLAPRDIAVLVRNHTEGVTAQRALIAAGIPCVRQGQQSVYQSHEAMELERVLQAISQPRREALVRSALLTDLLGVDVSALMQLECEATVWDAWLARFHHYHERWRDSGFMRMFRELTASEDVLQRLAGFADGERRLTNLLHLAECIQSMATKHTDIAAVMSWLGAMRNQPPVADENSLLRLESDEDRVRIATVHASKGLQYPVVFLPFAWDGTLRSGRANTVAFHDPDAQNQATVDFGSADLERHRARAGVEELAENLRVFYVALTRAQSRCYLAWGAVNGAPTSALAWLLHRPLPGGVPNDPTELAREFAGLSDDDLSDALDSLAANSEATIAICPLPSSSGIDSVAQDDAVSSLKARRAQRRLQSAWQMGSFSSMTTGHDSALPDFDSQLGRSRADEAGGFFAFPRGARAGTCVHRVFELIDFNAADLTARRQTAGQVLAEHGFDDKWTNVVDQMLDKVLQSPLNDDGLHLGTLAHTDRVDEMAFCYPVDALDAMHWREVLVRNTAGLHPALRLGLDDWHFEPLAGFMHGFIDLVFQASGRYYLVDYKSNYLGSDLGAYDATALNTTMHSSHYTLQYLIYTVALHRWLRTRIPDYSYEHHFGGAYYLFLRGMDPSHPGNGVFFDRPSADLIEDLDTLMGDPS